MQVAGLHMRQPNLNFCRTGAFLLLRPTPAVGRELEPCLRWHMCDHSRRMPH